MIANLRFYAIFIVRKKYNRSADPACPRKYCRLARLERIAILCISSLESLAFSATGGASRFSPPAAGGREPVNSRGTRLNAVTQAQTPLKAKQKTTLTGGLLFVTQFLSYNRAKVLILIRFFCLYR